MRTYPIAEALKQGGVGLRPPKRFSLGVDGRDSTARHQDARWSASGTRFLSNFLTKPVVLLRSRSHERHGRIVLIETPATEFLRYRLRRTEIHHIESTERN